MTKTMIENMKNAECRMMNADFSDCGFVDSRPVPEPRAPAVPIGQQIADFALQFAGYSYVYGSSSPESGFDCSGLTSYVYRHFGYTISRTASQQFKNNGKPVGKEELLPGDLVFFSSDGAGVTHVGLYIGGGKFVNASNERTGVIVSSLSSDWYTKTWWGARRLVG
jgi:cell wall-associated NlpC family hydrolase